MSWRCWHLFEPAGAVSGRGERLRASQDSTPRKLRAEARRDRPRKRREFVTKNFPAFLRTGTALLSLKNSPRIPVKFPRLLPTLLPLAFRRPDGGPALGRGCARGDVHCKRRCLVFADGFTCSCVLMFQSLFLMTFPLVVVSSFRHLLSYFTDLSPSPSTSPSSNTITFTCINPPPAPLPAPPSQVGQRMEPPRDRRASPPCLLPDADGASTPACRGVLRQSLAKALAAQAVPGAYTLCYPGSLRTARTPAAIAEASAAGSRLLRPAASPRPTMELAAEVTADGAELWAQRARTQLHG